MIRKLTAFLLLVAAAALAVCAYAGYRADEQVAATARQALTGKPTKPLAAPDRIERLGLRLSHRQGEERSWALLAEFQRLSGRAESIPAPQAHQRFSALSDQLKAAAAVSGDPQLRSRLLTLLGLAQASDAQYGSVGMTEDDLRAEAIASLRRAIITDPGNDDAKKNLELLMRTDTRRKEEMRAYGKGTSGSGKPSNYPAPQQQSSQNSKGGANRSGQGGY
jgi:hypothetical protein